ncbi:MAG: hypothetical protein ACE5PV_07225 [Candidatus Poribacteria bacterium]
MAASTTIWFGLDKGTKWHDWVRIVNISNNRAKVLALVRDSQGRTVWSGERELNPYQPWVIPAEQSGADRRGDMSLQVRSDAPIVGERHLHHGKDSMAFPGASVEGGTVGRRLFFPELYSGGYDWLRIINVGEATALVSVIARDLNGRIIRQLSGRIRPLGFWIVSDKNLGQVNGTLEIQSTQPILGERQLDYTAAGKGSVGQLGQVIER